MIMIYDHAGACAACAGADVGVDTLHRRSLLLGVVLMPPIVAGLTWILQVGGAFVALYLWAFLLALALIMVSGSICCAVPVGVPIGACPDHVEWALLLPSLSLVVASKSSYWLLPLS